jgi:hypothetical protein
MDTVEKCLSTWPDVESMDTMGKDIVKEHSSKRRSEVEGMDMVCIHMVEDMTTEVERVDREHGRVVLVKHQTNDGAESN